MVEKIPVRFIGAKAGVGVRARADEKNPRAGQKRTGSATLITKIKAHSHVGEVCQCHESKLIAYFATKVLEVISLLILGQGGREEESEGGEERGAEQPLPAKAGGHAARPAHAAIPL